MSNTTPKKKSAGTDPLMLTFFENEVAALYASEQYTADNLPELKKLSSSAELGNVFEEIFAGSAGHISALERIFVLLQVTPVPTLPDSIVAISRTRDELLKESVPGSLQRDLSVILIYQKIAHYKISTYSGLSQIAKLMGRSDIAHILEHSLSDEKNAESALASVNHELVLRQR